MTSRSDAGSVVSSASRARRSLTNRLGAVFYSRSGHINEYYIELDEPTRHYGPGDIIKGTVILHVAKPLGITHIVLSLFGYVEVYKHHSAHRPGTRNSASREASGRGKRWVSEYYGDGFASLFEDEIVLCGEGRLDPKLYHFRFEAELPTNLNLPSSIDFERGTISYVVSSTITRPTSIGSANSCNGRKIAYRESIDVGCLPVPKPRVVTLEPVDSRSKRRSGLRRLTSYSTNNDLDHSSSKASARSRATSKADRPGRTVGSTERSRSNSPTSPSVASSLSAPSSVAVRESAMSSVSPSSKTSQSPKMDQASQSAQTITCNVQIGKAGCLPGDTVPLNISINHTKLVRSLNGIIVTLYRQARTEMHPHLPVTAVGKDEKFEDYYPRSKSGLGGMSLSAAGSSQVWRKDLSQTSSPLYVNPQSMSAEVKVNVRIPDEAFPSIRNAPGDMISFKYFIEVIIDIHGKLAHHASTLLGPNLNGVLNSPTGASTDTFSNEPRGQVMTAWGTNCIDTSTLQRERNALVICNNLIVGTKDSAKSRSKRKQEAGAPNSEEYGYAKPQQINGWSQPEYDAHQQEGYSDGYYEAYDGYEYGYEHGYGQNYDPSYYDPSWNYEDDYNYRQASSNHDFAVDTDPILPLPSVADERHLSEKERLRRAEQQLLPSRPPDFDGDSSATHAFGITPTAPYLPPESDFDNPMAYREAVARTHHSETNASFLNPAADHHLPTYSPHDHQQSCAPRHNPSADSSNTASTTVLAPAGASRPSTDDKQELERRRLQDLASAPDTTPSHLPDPGAAAPLIQAIEGSGLGTLPAEQVSDPSLQSEPSAPDADEVESSITPTSGKERSCPPDADGHHLDRAPPSPISTEKLWERPWDSNSGEADGRQAGNATGPEPNHDQSQR